jgi:hypothetical protein
MWGVDIQQQAVDRFEHLYRQVRFSFVSVRRFVLTAFVDPSKETGSF